MQLRKFGHSCLLVSSGDGRVLIDPGTFSSGFEDLDGLTAVLITHQHPDHLDVGRLEPLLERNPDARLVTDVGTAQVLRDAHGIEANVATAGDSFDVGIAVDVVGEQHAEIYPEIPRIPNAGYVLDGRLLHPGDALDVTDRDVEVLALPAMAPWMRMAEAIDYLRAVAPRFAVPIHEGMLRSTDIYYGAFRNLGPDGTELRVIDDGQPVEL
jgi:L-ascorbate metabolism protein UlaG (beta-lactamase superfamily)